MKVIPFCEYNNESYCSTFTIGAIYINAFIIPRSYHVVDVAMAAKKATLKLLSNKEDCDVINTEKHQYDNERNVR